MRALRAAHRSEPRAHPPLDIARSLSRTRSRSAASRSQRPPAVTEALAIESALDGFVAEGAPPPKCAAMPSDERDFARPLRPPSHRPR